MAAQENYTALHFAAELGRAAIVQQLLQKGANPDARTTNGFTALMKAVGHEGCEEVVKLLLENGADPNAKDAVRTSAA